MAALTKDRNTARMGVPEQMREPPVAASTKIFQGSIVALNASGLAVPGSTATTQRAWGCATEQADNSAGIASAINVPVEVGTFKFGNSSAGDLIAQADTGNVCFIVDDQTVAKTDGGATRSKAGLIVQVDADGGVWVEIGERAFGL